jgi:pSer/pThr/pTyr-binding forkhead associated (FHA) protein
MGGQDQNPPGLETRSIDGPINDELPMLLVVTEKVVASHPLPKRGPVVIGRDSKADIQIDDPSVSRRHLELLLGEPVWVRDLGSHNGTHIGRDKLEADAPTELVGAQTIRIGSVILVLTLPSSEQVPTDPKEAERRRVVAALIRTGGNQTEAAQLLAMSRRTLVRRLEELDIPRPRKRD